MDTVQVPYLTLGTMLRKILFEQFSLHKPVSNYYDNVRVFKLAVTRLKEGIDQLATPARMRWWAQHTVPDDVQYNAIAATMPAACGSPRACRTSSLLSDGRAHGYDARSMDFRSNRAGFHTIAAATGKAVNDGQVALDRAMFWPGFAQDLNPAQPPFQAALLSIFNTHHWAMCVPGFDPLPNYFPRRVLLEAIVAHAALSQ